MKILMDESQRLPTEELNKTGEGRVKKNRRGNRCILPHESRKGGPQESYEEPAGNVGDYLPRWARGALSWSSVKSKNPCGERIRPFLAEIHPHKW